MTATLDTSITRMHHHAFVTSDHERNRHFIEDLIGLPLVATWCEHSPSYNDMPFCHTFYELADGSALAFFQMAPPNDERFLIGETNRYDHIALSADEASLQAICSRLDAEGGEVLRSGPRVCQVSVCGVARRADNRDCG